MELLEPSKEVSERTGLGRQRRRQTRRPANTDQVLRELSLKALARRIVLADRTLSVLMDYITDKRIIKLLCPYFSLILRTTKIWQRCEACFVLPERYTPPIITPYSRILFGYTDKAPELCGIKL